MDRDYRAELAESEKQHQRAKTTYGGIAGGISQTKAVEREKMRPQAAEDNLKGPGSIFPNRVWTPDLSDVVPQAGAISAGAYVPSLAEEAEKRSGYHSDIATKAAQASLFFRQHPEFEEFIRLIRNGAIQL